MPVLPLIRGRAAGTFIVAARLMARRLFSQRWSVEPAGESHAAHRGDRGARNRFAGARAGKSGLRSFKSFSHVRSATQSILQRAVRAASSRPSPFQKAFRRPNKRYFAPFNMMS